MSQRQSWFPMALSRCIRLLVLSQSFGQVVILGVGFGIAGEPLRPPGGRDLDLGSLQGATGCAVSSGRVPRLAPTHASIKKAVGAYSAARMTLWSWWPPLAGLSSW